MLLSNVSVGVPVAVALLFRTTVHTPPTTDDETILVLAGMPVPVTETPAPIATFVVANVTLGDPLVVDPTAVNTPRGVKVVLVKVPTRGRVFTEFDMN